MGPGTRQTALHQIGNYLNILVICIIYHCCNSNPHAMMAMHIRVLIRIKQIDENCKPSNPLQSVTINKAALEATQSAPTSKNVHQCNASITNDEHRNKKESTESDGQLRHPHTLTHTHKKISSPKCRRQTKT